MKRSNLVRDRFLSELNSWLTPSVLYHCFTGEGDAYQLAHVERIQPAQRHILLNMAELQWPKRLENIAAERKAHKQESKAAVRAFVQVALVSADAEPHHPIHRLNQPPKPGHEARHYHLDAAGSQHSMADLVAGADLELGGIVGDHRNPALHQQQDRSGSHLGRTNRPGASQA